MANRRKKPARKGQNNGLIAATLIAFGFVILIGYYVLTGDFSTTEDFDPGFDVPDITDLDQESGKGLSIQLTDEDDRTRLTGLIEAESVEPLDGGIRLVEKPNAWVFLKDGRSVHVSAESGRFFMPDEAKRPESGTLIGDVRIRLFDAIPSGERPDLDTTPPAIDLTTEEPLEFDFRLSRVSSTGDISVQSAEVDFRGRHLTLLLNQVRERIQLLEIRDGGSAVLRTVEGEPEPPAVDEAPASEDTLAAAPTPRTSPERDAVAEPPTAEPAPIETAAAAGNSPGKPASPPVIDRYRVICLDGVSLISGTRVLEADRADAWVRLEDRALPERTQLGRRPTASTPRRTALADIVESMILSQAADDPPADLTDASGSASSAMDTASSTISWSGMLRVTPIADGESPAELEASDAVVRFTAEDRGLVSFADTGIGAHGEAAVAAYDVTRRLVTLSGPGRGGVELVSDEAGTIVANLVEVDAFNGEASVRGPGEITMLNQPEGGATTSGRVSWSESALFTFLPDDEGPFGSLVSAGFVGGVDASAEAGRFRGDALDVEFIEIDGAPSPTRITGTGATFERENDARLTGTSLDITINDGLLQRVVGQDGVEVTDARGRVTAEAIDVTFLEQDGESVVEIVEAEGDVRLRETDGIMASGDKLWANPATQQARLSSGTDRQASVTRSDVTLWGEDILVSADDQTIDVPRAGRLVQAGLPGQGPAVDLRWTGSMRFDQSVGIGICEGGVELLHTPDAARRDVLKGDRVRVMMLPEDSEPDAVDGAGLGIAEASISGESASVEMRAFEEQSNRALAQLVYIESSEITYDAMSEVLDVPAAGRLLVVDRRGADAEGPPALGGPGRTLFRWDESFFLNRSEGEATMNGRVTMTRRADNSDETVQADASTMTAQFSTDDENGDTTLRSVSARGGVDLSDSARRIRGQRLDYDAEAGELVVLGTRSDPVVIVDLLTGRPQTAGKITWDLNRDIIRVDRPGAGTLSP